MGVRSLQQKYASLGAEIERLKNSIFEKRKYQANKTQEGLMTIGKIAAELLRTDLPREEEFINAVDVIVDFEKNTFAINGRNQFSASSIVYLKNCVHYAVFFASLSLNYFRYPRFILCDNMEDKGMEEERSHKFQHSVIDMCKKFSGEYQIIFTTSMIAPEFENSKFCVGEHYTQNRKTLRVK